MPYGLKTGTGKGRKTGTGFSVAMKNDWLLPDMLKSYGTE